MSKHFRSKQVCNKQQDINICKCNIFSMSKYMKYVIAFLVFVMVGSHSAFGLINVVDTSDFDALSETPYQGEEIYSSITIYPNNNLVTDMEIKIVSGADALIDYSSKSFDESSIPAAAVNLQKVVGTNVRTYTCENLEPGQELTLSFRAYPKTVTENEIEVAKVTISYNQLGDYFEKTVTIKTDTSDSSWHYVENADQKLEDAEQKLEESEQKSKTAQRYMSISIGIIILLCMALIGAFIVMNRGPVKL